MLSYELCKALKSAGFPQPHRLNREYYTFGGSLVGGWQIEKVEDGFLLIPILGDLIEMCGDKFTSLHRNPNTGTWSAIAFTAPQLEGITPEEAVANLWLSLNEQLVLKLPITQ